MIAHGRGEEARLRSMQSVRSWGNRGAQENFRNGGEVSKVVFGYLMWVWRDYIILFDMILAYFILSCILFYSIL